MKDELIKGKLRKSILEEEEEEEEADFDESISICVRTVLGFKL